MVILNCQKRVKLLQGIPLLKEDAPQIGNTIQHDTTKVTGQSSHFAEHWKVKICGTDTQGIEEDFP